MSNTRIDPGIRHITWYVMITAGENQKPNAAATVVTVIILMSIQICKDVSQRQTFQVD